MPWAGLASRLPAHLHQPSPRPLAPVPATLRSARSLRSLFPFITAALASQLLHLSLSSPRLVLPSLPPCARLPPSPRPILSTPRVPVDSLDSLVCRLNSQSSLHCIQNKESTPSHRLLALDSNRRETGDKKKKKKKQKDSNRNALEALITTRRHRHFAHTNSRHQPRLDTATSFLILYSSTTLQCSTCTADYLESIIDST